MAVGAKIRYRAKTGKVWHTFLMISGSPEHLQAAGRKEIEARRGDPNTMEYMAMWGRRPLPVRRKK